MLPNNNPFTPEDKLEKTYEKSALQFLIAGLDQPSTFSINGNYDETTYLNNK